MKVVTQIFLFLFLTTSAFGFEVMTEDYPPFNYQEDGKITGLATEVIRELFKKTGHEDNIKLMPWARIYKKLLTSPNKIVYLMTRTKQRENQMKWVGPVAQNKWVFFARKGSQIKIQSLDDARKVGSIGTYREDVCESFLKSKGFTNLESVPVDQRNVEKLIRGRIDLWIVGELQGFFKAGRDHHADEIEKVYEIKTSDLYIAFSKETPDSIIAQWQAALDELKQNGRFDEIISGYLN